MISLVVSRLEFEIRQYRKKSVTVGLLANKKISIVIILEFKITKKSLFLDLDQWFSLMSENNYKSIIDYIQIRSNRVRITDTLSR